MSFRRCGFANEGATWWRRPRVRTAAAQRFRRYAVHVTLSRDPSTHRDRRREARHVYRSLPLTIANANARRISVVNVRPWNSSLLRRLSSTSSTPCGLCRRLRDTRPQAWPRTRRRPRCDRSSGDPLQRRSVVIHYARRRRSPGSGGRAIILRVMQRISFDALWPLSNSNWLTPTVGGLSPTPSSAVMNGCCA